MPAFLIREHIIREFLVKDASSHEDAEAIYQTWTDSAKHEHELNPPPEGELEVLETLEGDRS